MAAAAKASAIPVLPLVGSMRVAPGSSSPRASASSMSATPTRSFTLPQGLRDSSLARIVASTSALMRSSATSGVRPTVSVTFRKIMTTL